MIKPGGLRADQVPATGLRRLSAAEYLLSVRAVTDADDLPAFEFLPTDPRSPFDNDYRLQIPSEALINAADFLAQKVSEELIDDPARLASVIECTPAGPRDEDCMRRFVESFGRRVFRRPLSTEDIDGFLFGVSGDDGAMFYADAENSFAVGVDFVVRAMLQDPEFLYRIEIGEEVSGEPGLYRLQSFEVASRLSFLLWGSGPDDALLDLAAEGGLATPEQRREAAKRMFADPLTRARIERFHAQWFGYEGLVGSGDLSGAMQAETGALLSAIIFEDDAAWQDLFRATETFVNDELAEHYGLTPPGSDTPAWTPYGDSGRRGLLSHGSFLSIGALESDTSPVLRGKVIRERLLCQDIPDPPPEVSADEDPGAGEQGFCKPDRYAAHTVGECAGCHDQLDPVGFGLERYDSLGRFRTTEPDDPETPEDESTCAIDGHGEIAGVGEFNGPGELGELALSTGLVSSCLITQAHRFTIGRGELDMSGADGEVIDALVEEFGARDFTFQELMLEIVADATFGYRSYDEGQDSDE